MQIFIQRTDLATESRELVLNNNVTDIEGITYEECEQHGISCQILTVLNEDGSNSISKPIGEYYTIEIDSVIRRESDSFNDTASVIASFIKKLAGNTSNDNCTLVVGLGNRNITPDVIGPLTIDSILVTRHLKEHAPEDFKFLSPVAAIQPGVLGTSGIESADYIKWVCDNLKPRCVIAVDALAARNLNRLCRTIQITNTGITPGSGVGNSRHVLNSEFLGVPVVAVGVPTVVDMRSIIADFCNCPPESIGNVSNDMIVTPRNIDSEASSISRLIAYAINLALHDGLTLEDIDMLVG